MVAVHRRRLNLCSTDTRLFSLLRHSAGRFVGCFEEQAPSGRRAIRRNGYTSFTLALAAPLIHTTGRTEERSFPGQRAKWFVFRLVCTTFDIVFGVLRRPASGTLEVEMPFCPDDFEVVAFFHEAAKLLNKRRLNYCKEVRYVGVVYLFLFHVSAMMILTGNRDGKKSTV